MAYLGLDLGGTGVKAGIFDAEGVMLGFGRRTYQPEEPAPGRAELDIDVLLQAAREAVREAVAAANCEIQALAVSSQGQTFVPLDAENRPLHPAIMWYDDRAMAIADELNQALEGRHTFTGICSAVKIAWLKRRRASLMAQAVSFLLLPDLINRELTGLPVTDPNTAGSTGFYRDGYISEALDLVGVNVNQLARVQETGSVCGKIMDAAAADWHLPAGMKIITGTNDQYAGALGAGNVRPGIVSAATGTCIGLVTLTPELPDPLPKGLHGGRFPLPDMHFILAFSRIAGVLLRQYRDSVAPGTELSVLDREAAERAPDGNILRELIPRLEKGDAGLADLSVRHGRGAVFRGIMEWVAFGLRMHLQALGENGFKAEIVRATGGGACSAVWLQIQADVSGHVIEKPAVTEAPMLGAAMIAAAGDGAFESLAGASQELYRVEAEFTPDQKRHAVYSELYEELSGGLTGA
ncbi:FGGY-family carbohydrate kinase [Planctomycetota bacterium]